MLRGSREAKSRKTVRRTRNYLRDSACYRIYIVIGMGENMQVDLIFKVAAIGILVAVLNQLLIRSGREEQAMMTTLAGLIVVLMMIIQEISNLFSYVKSTFGF